MKIVFLDRDGVINEFPGNGNYVTRVKNFRFIVGALDAIKKLTDEGYEIFVISNQAGVGKRVYSQKKLDHITRNMLRDVVAYGGKIKQVYYCTHKSDDQCDCRKPGIGNIEKALKARDTRVDLGNRAFFVGDTKSDILTGYNARCQTILVLSGRARRKDVKDWGIKPDYIVKDLKAATKIILNNYKQKKG